MMVSVTSFTTSRHIGPDDFARDPHAAKYRGELSAHPEAFERLLSLLNDQANEQRLVDAEHHDMPALCGVVHQLETDPTIESVLAVGPASYRFRQAVGVAVKLKMAKLGWHTTGRKGAVRGADHFVKAERYVADDERSGSGATAAALDAILDIGDDAERDRTGQDLMEALASSRRTEGRPF